VAILGLCFLLLALHDLVCPSVAAAQPYSDALLEQLIQQSIEARPELQESRSLARAERERIPQAGAFPDPVLTLGMQNDGFQSIQIGKAETSFYLIELSQPLPWPGKRGLRTSVATLAARQVEVRIARVRLSAEADVRRAHLALVLVRERLALLERLAAIWQKSEGIARSRYEAGEGAQSDLLRAQLELNRLRKRRWSLQAEEQTETQTLNRLRGRPLDEAIQTTAKMREMAVPPVTDLETALTEAKAHSPELAAARLGVSRTKSQADLARREQFPDLGVNGGIMPRGDLEPMWRANVSVGLPVWWYRKQGRAVSESDARAAAETQSAEAIEQILRLRVAERRVALATLVSTIQLYEQGLLVQSHATAESTLAQYGVGKVTFASVLDANAGYLSDEEEYLLTIAEAQQIAIANAELTLERVGLTDTSGAAKAPAFPAPGGASGAPSADSSSSTSKM
jgi:outer membrane protein TolC